MEDLLIKSASRMKLGEAASILDDITELKMTLKKFRQCPGEEKAVRH